MSDEFDPNWPHGHLMRWANGETRDGRIIATDLGNEIPIAFYSRNPDAIYRFCENGHWIGGKNVRLINAPAPVKHAEAWVNVYRWPSGKVSVDYVYETIDKARHGEDASYLGSIHISTETADIIGPNGEKVKL